MTTIRAIETSYAGCRFRSRLEARWAVFFDRLGMRWQYEPQGFALANGQCYLPDFYLVDQGVYAEVKGSTALLREDWERLELFAAGLRPPAFLVVLGEVPDTEGGWAVPRHPVIGPNGGQSEAIMVLSGLVGMFLRVWTGGARSTEPSFMGGISPWPQVTDAYAAARKARFEHGERG